MRVQRANSIRPSRACLNSGVGASLRVVSLIVLLLAALLVGSAVAQERDQAPRDVDALDRQWARVVQAVRQHDLARAYQRLEETRALSSLMGISSLEEYSLFLFATALERLAAHDYDAAAVYTEGAARLSPRSPDLILRTVPVLHKLGISTLLSVVPRWLNAVLSRPDEQLQLIAFLLYPALWALTLSAILLLSLALYSALGRGALRPSRMVLAGGVVLAAAAFGPLWCLAALSVVLMRVNVPRRVPVVLGALTLLLWGIVIPARETLLSWTNDDAMQVVRRSAAQVMVRDPEAVTTTLRALLTARPDDPLVVYALTRHLVWTGQSPAAKEVLQRHGNLLEDSRLQMEQGMVALAAWDLAGAARSFERAEQFGLRSPELFFNLSRVKFELGDTAGSSAYVGKAAALSSKALDAFREREEIAGPRSVSSIAWPEIPYGAYLRSALNQTSRATPRIRERTAEVMPLMTPLRIVMLAIALVILTLLWRPQRKMLPGVLAVPRGGLLSLVPGSVGLSGGRPVRAWLTLSVFTLLLLILVRWPWELRTLYEVVPSLFPLALVAFVVLYVGMLTRRVFSPPA